MARSIEGQGSRQQSARLASDQAPVRAKSDSEQIEAVLGEKELVDRDAAPVEHGRHLPTQEIKSHLVFRFLRRQRDLPGRKLLIFMQSALFLVMFLAGWNDGTQGPLLPFLQSFYDVNYLIISLIWVATFLGFMTAGVTNIIITDRLGFGIAAPFGSLMQAVGYVFMCWGGPYPLFVIAYVLNGFGLGLQDAQVNSLTSRLPNASTMMFLMHAVYGAGATVSPLVATPYVEHVSRAYTYYAISLALAVSTFAVLILAFRGRTEDQVVGQRAAEEADATASSLPAGSLPTVPTGATEAGEKAAQVQKQSGSGHKMKRVLSNPAAHYMAFYIMIYVGVEVTIGGWATTYILTERGGNENSGYVSVGYFGGLTLGRVILIPLTDYLGKHRSIYIYSAIVLALELVVWFVRSIPGNAVAFAFIGFFLGPMYPIVMMVCTEVMPAELQGGTIGWIASVGQGGSAIMPFITGAISDRYGVWVLQPLMIGFIVVDVGLWAFVPRRKTT